MKADINEIKEGVAEVTLELKSSDAVITGLVVLNDGYFFHLTFPPLVKIAEGVIATLDGKSYLSVLEAGAEVSINEALAEYYEANNDGQKLANMGY